MMKKVYLSMLTAVAMTLSFTSCSSDSDPIPVPTPEVKPVYVGFENQTLNADKYWCGVQKGQGNTVDDGWGGTVTKYPNTYVEDVYTFNTNFVPSWSSWSGYAISARTATTFSSATLFPDQFNSVTGKAYEGNNFCVVYPQGETIDIDGGATVKGFYVTNSAYVYTSMTNGDTYAKKFELGDWFKLTITGYDAKGNATGTKEFYLADLRDASLAYIIKDWCYVDLSGLGKVYKIGFTLSSSDNNTWGMNTPAYFCMDNFGAEGIEVTPAKNVTL